MNRLSVPQRAAIIAAAHSFWVTGIAIIGGLIMGYVSDGMHGSFLAYVRANAVLWATTNLVTPSVRAFLAHRNASLGITATTPDTPATPAIT